MKKLINVIPMALANVMYRDNVKEVKDIEFFLNITSSYSSFKVMTLEELIESFDDNFEKSYEVILRCLVDGKNGLGFVFSDKFTYEVKKTIFKYVYAKPGFSDSFKSKIDYADFHCKLTEMEMVDEQGNPVGLSSIDLTEVECSDVDGKPIDAFGDYLDNDCVALSDNLITLATSQIQVGVYSSCLEIIEYALDTKFYSDRKQVLYNLQGICNIEMNKLYNAKESFISGLQASGNNLDTLLLVNFITVCCQLEDKTTVLKGLKLYFDGVTAEHKYLIIDSLEEAIKTSLIRVEELPPSVLIFWGKCTSEV